MKKKEVKKTTEKYVTEKTFNKFEGRFDDSMRAVAKSFTNNAEVMAKSFTNNAEVMAIMLKEIRTIHEDNKYFRQNISSLNFDGLSYDRKIENLTLRVEKLELK